MGNLFASGSPPPAAGFNAFGEAAGAPSRLPPSGRAAGSDARHVVASAAAAGALLAGGLLRCACAAWGDIRGGASPEDVLVSRDAMLHQARAGDVWGGARVGRAAHCPLVRRPQNTPKFPSKPKPIFVIDAARL